jgi:hypothetical protein
MPDTKQDVLEMLRELIELTLLDEADPQSFRVRAQFVPQKPLNPSP